MTDDLKAALIAKLDEAQRIITEARALLYQQPQTKARAYENDIMAALIGCRKPLSMIEIVNATGLDYNTVGITLTRLYRTNRVTRERVRRDGSNRLFYVYRPAGEK